MSLIPAIHSWNLTNYARRINSKNEFVWSCLDANQTSLKMTITPALQLMILSSDQCIEELLGNRIHSICQDENSVVYRYLVNVQLYICSCSL